MFSPWAWLAVGALVLSLFGGTYYKGYTGGKARVQAEWDQDKDVRKIAEQAAVAGRLRDNEAKAAADAAIKSKTRAKYENDLSKLRADSDAARSSGLRVNASICSGLAASAVTASASIADGPAAIKLPAATERRLFDIADDAEKCSVQLTNLQKWIVDSGLYKE